MTAIAPSGRSYDTVDKDFSPPISPASTSPQTERRGSAVNTPIVNEVPTGDDMAAATAAAIAIGAALPSSSSRTGPVRSRSATPSPTSSVSNGIPDVNNGAQCGARPAEEAFPTSAGASGGKSSDSDGPRAKSDCVTNTAGERVRHRPVLTSSSALSAASADDVASGGDELRAGGAAHTSAAENDDGDDDRFSDSASVSHTQDRLSPAAVAQPQQQPQAEAYANSSSRYGDLTSAGSPLSSSSEAVHSSSAHNSVPNGATAATSSSNSISDSASVGSTKSTAAAAAATGRLPPLGKGLLDGIYDAPSATASSSSMTSVQQRVAKRAAKNAVTYGFGTRIPQASEQPDNKRYTGAIDLSLDRSMFPSEQEWDRERFRLLQFVEYGRWLRAKLVYNLGPSAGNSNGTGPTRQPSSRRP